MELEDKERGYGSLSKNHGALSELPKGTNVASCINPPEHPEQANSSVV